MHTSSAPHEPHDRSEISNRLNWLRASVLGANDGIVSVAGLVVGIAGATTNIHALLVAGLAGLFAGAMSMAVGEYISVSSQRDTEEALIDSENFALKHYPEQELDELIEMYKSKGLATATATKVAKELTAHDALGAHLDVELGMRKGELASPTNAALASAVSFTLGASIPLLAILLPPQNLRVPITFIAVVIALIITGQISATIGKSNRTKATIRVVIGGILAMTITYGIGSLFSVNL